MSTILQRLLEIVEGKSMSIRQIILWSQHYLTLQSGYESYENKKIQTNLNYEHKSEI